MITGNDLRNLKNTLSENTRSENTPSEDTVDYLVEHLDYTYISQCDDAQQLLRLESVLKSGKEGEYPHLLEFLQKKIQKLLPQMTQEFTAQDFQDLVHSLQNLENQSLENSKKLQLEKEFPKDFSKIKTFSKDLSSNAVYTQSLAEREKEKGNECFKAKEYNDAIVYYTRSLQIMKRAHVFTNRANAYLKIGQYEKAEDDSSAALEMNDSIYIFKSYLRRAEARRKRGKLWDALKDLDSALKIDPSSSLAINLRNQIEKEYKKVEGDLAKDTRGPKSRIKIEETLETTHQLEPSSITEVTEEEADLLLKSKDSKDSEIKNAQDFVQGLKTLAPSFDFGESRVPCKTQGHEIKSMLQVQDIEQADDDIDVFTKEIESRVTKINVTDQENYDDDCVAFQKEAGKIVDDGVSNVRIKDTADIDDDCLLFKNEILPSRDINAAPIVERNSVSNSEGNVETVCTPSPLLFAAPKSSIEFEGTWNSIKGDIKQFASYLSCIDEKEVMKFLAMVSNADLHIDLILSTQYMKDTQDILNLVEFVTSLPRFSVVKSFMTRKQKAQFAATLEKLKSGVYDERIHAIFDIFKL